jgi:hypothetical protein
MPIGEASETATGGARGREGCGDVIIYLDDVIYLPTFAEPPHFRLGWQSKSVVPAKTTCFRRTLWIEPKARYFTLSLYRPVPIFRP